MPRLAKGPHLKLRKRPGAVAMYYIIDNDRRISTGFDAKHLAEAKEVLEAYIRSRHVPKPSEDYYVTQAIDLYRHDIAPRHERPKETEQCLARLSEFFRGHACDYVTPELTASYERWRCHSPKRSANEPERPEKSVSPASVRRELATLQAALNYAFKCRKLKHKVPVALPPKSAPKLRWLTRDEADRLLGAARDNEHLTRFILIGLATGTRASAILSLGWKPHPGGGYFDLDDGMLYRAPQGERETNKRKTPAPIPDDLLCHLKRWKQESQGLYVITAPGTADESIKRVTKGFDAAVKRAGLDRAVTPHTLRHTAVTWLMRAKEPAWKVGGFVGMSVQMVLENYGHHAPDNLRETANANIAPHHGISGP